MAFEPENPLEAAMIAAASDGNAHGEFYRLLLASELVALGRMDERLLLDTVRGPAGEFHPIFTSRSRIAAMVADPEDVEHFLIEGRKLFEIARGAQFVVNPGSSPNKLMSADEIAWCLTQFPARPDIIVEQPKVYPANLIKALCILFTSRAAIKAAHLVYVSREGVDVASHPMIGLEADGDVPRLAQEIFDAAEAVMPGAPVEVVYLDPAGPMAPLQKHLLRVAPFYRRPPTPN